MPDLSILIPARNEIFLARTIEDIIANMRGDTEVIAVCDGYWPEPVIKDHPRVHLIHHAVSMGQRTATNEAAKLSRSKYIMKADAHCAFDEGFDIKLMTDCDHDWTVVPRMYNLHAFDWVCQNGHQRYQGPPGPCTECNAETKMEIIWKPRLNRRSDFMRFDKDLKFQYWFDYEKRPEAKGDICDLMSFIGACWFMERSRYWEIDGLDENHGSWGQMGTEIACKSWLSGGRLVVNKKTWFSHMFRTNNAGFTFPYDISGKDINIARKHSKNLWIKGQWPKAIHPLSWLIDKFAPVPSWHD